MPLNNDFQRNVFNPDPLVPMLMDSPEKVIGYLTEMRRHYLALAAACERMVIDVRNSMREHDAVR